MMISSGPNSRWTALGMLVGVALSGVAFGQNNGLVRLYRLTQLDSESGGQTRAYALNNTGQVVGWVQEKELHHGAHWHSQDTTDLAHTVHFELLHPYPLFNQDYSETFAISDGGQIVGTARTSIKCIDAEIIISEACLLRPAVLTDLGTPYPGDALSNLGTFGNPCIAHDSAAVGISNHGHVVGWADRTDRVIHAFLVRSSNGRFYEDADGDFVNDLMTDLGTLVADADPVSSATDVNNAGQVTGYSYTVTAAGESVYRAFIITPADSDNDGVADSWYSGAGVGGVNELMVDLGALGGPNSWGRDINNNGAVAGEADFISSSAEHYTRAFLWAAGTMADLGTLHTDRNKGASAASAVNDKGIVVGWAENDDGARRAFLFENGTMQDLNTLLYLRDDEGLPVAPKIVLTEARDINEDGLIVGWGNLRGSDATETRGFLLTPIWVDPNELTEEDTAPVTDTEAPGQGGNYTSTTDFGPPAQTAGATETTTTETDPAPAVRSGGFCGVASFGALPAIAGGMLAMAACRRRWSVMR